MFGLSTILSLHLIFGSAALIMLLCLLVSFVISRIRKKKTIYGSALFSEEKELLKRNHAHGTFDRDDVNDNDHDSDELYINPKTITLVTLYNGDGKEAAERRVSSLNTLKIVGRDYSKNKINHDVYLLESEAGGELAELEFAGEGMLRFSNKIENASVYVNFGKPDSSSKISTYVYSNSLIRINKSVVKLLLKNL